MADTYTDLTPAEQAALDAWGRVSADTTGMLFAVRAAVAATERRYEESEDAQLVAVEADRDRWKARCEALQPRANAREWLARHLYIEGSAVERDAAQWWDSGMVRPALMEEYRRAADRALAAITGKEN